MEYIILYYIYILSFYVKKYDHLTTFFVNNTEKGTNNIF